jgi:hypothetical protein
MAVRLTGARRAMLVALASIPVIFLSGPAYAGVAVASDDPPSDRVTVDVVTVNGSGCPAGTADVEVSDDNTWFRIRYHNYTARIGGSSKPTDVRKNCQLALQAHIPQGFTYAIASVDYSGHARIADGAFAVQRANYYFQGSSQNHVVDHQFNGPYYGGWYTNDSTDWSSLVWAPCGEYRNLNINTSLRVNAGTSDPVSRRSYISMDDTEGGVDTIYHFAWKHC